MPGAIVIEIAVDSLADAQRAVEHGADRLELCSALDQHGLTPHADLVRAVKQAVSRPVMAMVRPRPGSFVCTTRDLEALARDADSVLAAGADGIVFGPLNPGFQVAEPATATLVALAKGRPTVFHRAFDLTPDPFAAVNVLVSLGVTRILTAGQDPVAAASAMGIQPAPAIPHAPDTLDTRTARLRALLASAAGRIEIMPGGGVRAANAHSFITGAGARQLHSSCRDNAALDPREVARLRAAADASVPN